MNPLESQLLAALENDQVIGVHELGGWKRLLADAPKLGASPFVDEFVKIAVSELRNGGTQHTGDGWAFICTCFESATSDIALPVVIDAIDRLSAFPGDFGKRLFRRALALAQDKSLRPVGRGAVIDGALRWALRPDSPSSRKYSLMSILLSVEASDDRIFLCRAAKIIGVCYTHWRLDELKAQLEALCKVDGVVQDAGFELAVANLEDALCAQDKELIRACLETSKFWFRTVVRESEQAPAARAYLECIEGLLAFEDKKRDPEGGKRTEEIHRQILDLEIYHFSPCDSSWLGARNMQITLWSAFAERLHQCTNSINDEGWLEPDLVIKTHLLAILSLNRSILQRDSAGIIKAIVKPRILDSMATHSWQRGILQKWIARNQGHDEAAVAQSILDEVVAQCSDLPDGNVSDDISRLSRLIDSRCLSTVTKDLIVAALLDSQLQYLSDLSAATVGILESCIESVKTHYDFSRNDNGRSLFRTVLLWTVSFLDSRCNISRKSAQVQYLFEAEGKPLPKEESLQQDYYQMMRSMVGHGARIEMPDIAGGRADVWFKLGAEHLVVEVKREMSDASFEALERSYSAQAAEYQNTSIRFGFVLVLDLTEVRAGGSIHMSELVQARQLIRSGEAEPRWLVFVKVPGRRLPPSKLQAK